MFTFLRPDATNKGVMPFTFGELISARSTSTSLFSSARLLWEAAWNSLSEDVQELKPDRNAR
jgi:hypothetical protein